MTTILVGRAIQFLLALLILRVATSLLSPAEMGKVSLALTTTAFFALFLVNPVGMFINRRLHSWQESGALRHHLIRYVGYLAAVAAVAACCLPLLYDGGLADFGMALPWLIALVCGSLLFNTINQTAIPSLNLLGHAGSFVALTVATLGASFLGATALVEWKGPFAELWLLGLLAGQTIVGFVGTWVLFKRSRRIEALSVWPIGKVQLHRLASFAWPVAIAAGLGWVQSQGFRYLVENYLGLAQLGLFVAGYGISAGMIAGFESVLTAYFQPRLYQDANAMVESERTLAWRRYAAAVIPSLLLTVALIVSLAPELTRLFLGERFRSSAQFVVWGALAEAARSVIAVYSLVAHVHMRTRWLILPSLVGALTAMASSVLLIREFGASGAGMALTFSGFAVVVAMHLLFARRAGGRSLLRPLLAAAAAAVPLWAAASFVREMLGASGWPGAIGLLLCTGLVYAFLQILLLRPHVTPTRVSPQC